MSNDTSDQDHHPDWERTQDGSLRFHRTIEKARKKPLPTFVLPLCLVGLLVVFQLIPYTGVILMIFGGVYLTLAAIQVTIICFILDAVKGTIPQVLLALPLGLIIFHAYNVIEEQVAISALEAKLQAENKVDVLLYDPAKHDLISKRAVQTVREFQVPTAYETWQRNRKETYFKASVLTSKVQCETVREDSQNKISKHTRSIKTPKGREDICILTAPLEPTKQRVTVKDTRAPEEYKGVKFGVTRTALLLDGKEQGGYLTAVRRKLVFWPLPWFGCGLNSGAPSWDCGGGFKRTIYRLEHLPEKAKERGLKDPLPLMLGLKKRNGLTEQDKQAAAPLLETAQGLAALVIDDAHEALARINQDPKFRGPSNFSFSLISDMDKLVANRKLLFETFYKYAGSDPKKDYNEDRHAKALAKAIYHMPLDYLKEEKDKLIQTLMDHKWWQRYPLLYVRMVDAGSASHPAYIKRYLYSPGEKRQQTYVGALALCRMPSLGPAEIAQLQTEFSRASRKKDQSYYEALFVALLRHGRLEEIRPYLEKDDALKPGRWYAKVIEVHSKAPSAMPNNCMMRRWTYFERLHPSMKPL